MNLGQDSQFQNAFKTFIVRWQSACVYQCMEHWKSYLSNPQKFQKAHPWPLPLTCSECQPPSSRLPIKWVKHISQVCISQRCMCRVHEWDQFMEAVWRWKEQQYSLSLGLRDRHSAGLDGLPGATLVLFLCLQWNKWLWLLLGSRSCASPAAPRPEGSLPGGPGILFPRDSCSPWPSGVRAVLHTCQVPLALVSLCVCPRPGPAGVL